VARSGAAPCASSPHRLAQHVSSVSVDDGMLTLTGYPPPPQHSSRHGPQHTQHTASTAATPRYPQGRRQTPTDAPTPLKRSWLTPFGGPRPGCCLKTIMFLLLGVVEPPAPRYHVVWHRTSLNLLRQQNGPPQATRPRAQAAARPATGLPRRPRPTRANVRVRYMSLSRVHPIHTHTHTHIYICIYIYI